MTLPFTPASTASISVTATSASASVVAGCQQVRMYNSGTKDCYVRWGVGAQTAVTTDMPLKAGTVEYFTKGFADTVAAICGGADTTTLLITSGAGGN